MKLKSVSLSNIKMKDIDYVKNVYKKRIQNEIDSYLEQEDNPDTIVSQDILYLDRFFI